MIADPLKLTRNELAKFLPSQRAIRAFEQLFDVIPSELNATNTTLVEISTAAGSAEASAQQAIGAIDRLAQAVELLALAPPDASVAQSFDIAPPVVQVSQITELAPPFVNDFRRKRYGAFHSTVTQTAAVINTSYPMTLNTTDISFGVYVGSPTSRVYMDTEGYYNFQFSAQLEKTTGGVGAVYIWCRVNGVDIPYSATKIQLQGNNAETVAAWNFVLQVKAGDYFELIWSTDDTHCQIFASAASSPVPAIPSVILTVTDNIS